MREVMTELGWRAGRNALVVLDEGQRWIPQDAWRDDDSGRLIQGHLRETRK
jgi:hypothetical protein